MTTAAQVRPRRGPSRYPTLVHLAGAIVLIVVLVPLVLRASQAAPPAIAEFAPQVTQTIQKAPPAQSSQLGNGHGGGASTSVSASPSPTATPTPPVLQVPPGARVNKCVGDPPRQIEDPQSPPCVPFWDPKQSNGGATAFGVTATTITIAAPAYTATNTGDLPTMVNFFNDRFEFYGRKLVLKTFADSGQDTTAEGMQADAQKVEQLGAFAELTYPLQDGAENIFYDALARLKNPVISVQGAISSLAQSSSAHLAAYDPYEWNYVATPDIIERNLGEMICKQLNGHPPSHAGSPTNLATTRKFGLMRESRAGLPPYDETLLVNAIQACTQQPLTKVDFDVSPQDMTSAITKMNSAGVTSVICLCQTNLLEAYFFPEAQGQSYQPEWITSNIGDQDGNESLWETAAPAEAGHAIGLRSKNKVLPNLDMPYTWAIHYESPNNPKPPYNNVVNVWDDWSYTDLLLLASGIQLAGPHLTPQTFAAGLARAQFPNPGCDGSPYYQACVGFAGGAHTMQQSFAQIYWDPNHRGPDAATGSGGSYCYVRLGARRSLSDWSGSDPYAGAACG